VIDGNVDSRLAITELLFEYTRPIICSSVKEGLRMVSGKRYPFVAVLIDSEIADEKILENLKSEELSVIVIGNDVPKPINKIKLLDTLYRTINNTAQFQLNESEPINATNVPIKDLSILVAEDMEYNREMLIEMLKSLGYTNITSCRNGEEAVQKMVQIPYDIVLLDLRMPVKSGLEVVEWMRKNGRKEKIAIITASIQESDRNTCRELGVKYFLLKPFSMVHLKSILYKLINGTQFCANEK
jgi:CheY-like chemotaxis protein